MKTITKKIFIIVAAVLSALCFTAGFALSTVKPVKAAGAFTVEGGELLLRQPYNGAAGGMRTEYLITFDAAADIFAGFSDGDEITDETAFSEIGTNISHNEKTVAQVAGGYKAYKYAENVLKLVVGRPVGYAKLTFNAGLTLNGYSLANTKILCLNEYGVFTDTEEVFRPISVYERPDGSNRLWLDFAMNRGWYFQEGGGTFSELKNVTFNGVSIVDANGQPNAPCVNISTEWDAGQLGFQTHIYFANAEFAKLVANGGVLIAKAGLKAVNNQTTSATYGFAIESGNIHGDWNYMPAWKPIKGFADAALSYVGESGGKYIYKIALTNTKDLENSATAADFIADFNKNDDMTAFIRKYSSLYSQMELDGDKLSAIAGVTFKKGESNEILMSLSYRAAEIYLPAGSVVGNAFVSDEAEINVARTDISVLGVYGTHSYGYNCMKNQTSFRVKFSSLTSDSLSANVGDDITSYFTGSKFTDNLLVNGGSLKSILAQPYRSLKVYYGVRDKADKYPGIYDYDPGDVTDSLEFVLTGMQLFDYDVTVKAGCAFADLIVAGEDVTYRKQDDETFAELEPVSDVKAMSIREIPNGDKNYRTLYIVFSGVANGGNTVLPEGTITFSQTVTAPISSQFFANEPEYGGRNYRMLVNAAEYQAFLVSDNPTITISSFGIGGGKTAVATEFVLKNGTFTEINDTMDHGTTGVVAVAHPGNQENDLKLFRIEFNTSLNYYIIGDFLKDNLYMNGKKVYDYKYAAGYANSEYQWDCRYFSIYIDDNIRNYDGGVDVLCIKKGVPLAGGKTTSENIYFYGIKHLDERDGAWNWKWTFSAEKPDLKILSGADVAENNGKVSATVNFDRVVDKNDTAFTSTYNGSLNMKSKIKVNGKVLSEYAGADYAFTENGLTVILNKSDLDSDYLYLELAEGFTVPNGFTVGEPCKIAYGFSEKIWASDFTKAKIGSFTANPVKSISEIKTVRVGGTAANPVLGKRIAVTFNDKIVGKQVRTGTRPDYGKWDKIQWLKNVTAPYADLKVMTERGYAGELDYIGYEYTPEIMDRFVYLGIRDSVLDGITINGKTLREIAEADADKYVVYSSYPVTVDYVGDIVGSSDESTMYITVSADSSIYEELTTGVRLGLNKRIVFETETRTDVDTYFVLKDTGWEEGAAYVNGITVRNMKSSYYIGSDLDYTKIIASTVLSNDEEGESFTVTADMISGYDKNKAGKQTVTVTYHGFTATFEVTVIDNTAPDKPVDPDDPAKSGGGCGSSASGDMLLLLAGALAVSAVVFTKSRKKEKR